MNLPPEAHSFFSAPVFPRASFKGKRTRSRRKSASGSSSSSDADSTAPASTAHSRATTAALTTPSPPPAGPSFTPVNRTTRTPSPSPPPGALSDGSSDAFHRPPLSRRGRQNKHHAALLAAHNLVPVPQAPWNLRAKHIAVITTLLHRCLLTHDWTRARRAYGLLLRGKDVDVRRVWGVGVDILLRVGETEKAVEFLDRLVLFFPYRARLHGQHPALAVSTGHGEAEGGKSEGEGKEGGQGKGRGRGKRKKQPRADTRAPHPSAIEFNPALFSLLIEASGCANVSGVDDDGDGDEIKSGVGSGGNGGSGGAGEPEKIKERLEVLMLSPPWSDLEALKVLRGMVCLWMADLECARGGGAGGRGGGGDGGQREVEDALRREAREWIGGVREAGGTLPVGLWEGLVGREREREEERGRKWDSDSDGDVDMEREGEGDVKMGGMESDSE
ncbi:RNA polymerase I-specific initiation factor-domain-containing protein [Geopyxis carbonaria]|nr:RNA polymerase I-specific initiation factor-domain-containing protein [Geopyxis carbonaria]